VKIVIQDNGEGIKGELQDRIFNMFFRASHSAKGSGLGLYIAKEAADKIRGTISVESEYGVGSKFILKINGV
jgi:signal transduction histidine kinase